MDLLNLQGVWLDFPKQAVAAARGAVPAGVARALDVLEERRRLDEEEEDVALAIAVGLAAAWRA